MALKGIFTVVYMNCLQSFEPYNLIKLCKHAVKVAHNIVTCIVHMASIKTNAHFIFQFDSVDNFTQFFKATAHLTALACHCFKQYRGMHILPQYGIELVGDKLYSRFNALLHMTARVKIIHISGDKLHTL